MFTSLIVMPCCYNNCSKDYCVLERVPDTAVLSCSSNSNHSDQSMDDSSHPLHSMYQDTPFCNHWNTQINWVKLSQVAYKVYSKTSSFHNFETPEIQESFYWFCVLNLPLAKIMSLGHFSLTCQNHLKWANFIINLHTWVGTFIYKYMVTLFILPLSSLLGNDKYPCILIILCLQIY